MNNYRVTYTYCRPGSSPLKGQMSVKAESQREARQEAEGLLRNKHPGYEINIISVQ